MSIAVELERLDQMYREGKLTEADYEAAKRRLLNPGKTSSSIPPVVGAAPGTSGFNTQPIEDSVRKLTGDPNIWGALVHFTQLLNFFPLAGFIVPIIIWQLKKEDPIVNEHGKNAVNFMITSFIALLIGGLLTLVVIGFVIVFAVAILVVVFPIIAGIKALNGQVWEYPLTYKFLK